MQSKVALVSGTCVAGILRHLESGMPDISATWIGSAVIALLIAPPVVTAALLLVASFRQKLVWRKVAPADESLDAA